MLFYRDVPRSVNGEVHSSNTTANKSPHRNEPKLSLSEYHTSLSSSGEETPLISSQEQTTPKIAQKDNTVRVTEMESFPTTSTPIRGDINVDTCAGAVGFSPVTRQGTGSTNNSRSADNSEFVERRKKRVSFVDPLDVKVPLIGYEVMEQRAKFTVSFKN
jgi:hypothetical protein